MHKASKCLFVMMMFLSFNNLYADTEKFKYCPSVEALYIKKDNGSENKIFYTVFAWNNEGKYFSSYPLSYQPAPVKLLSRETNYYSDNKTLECGYYAYQHNHVYVYLYNRGDY